jgi:uncharacterized membrane protein YuzA (DUF378 family)
MAEPYRGLVGGLWFAFRESPSLLFRAYAVVGVLTSALVSLVVAFGLVDLIAATSGGPGGSLTLSRSFYVVVGLAVVAPLLAPVLLVARARRRGDPVPPTRYDRALGVAGFAFFLLLYVGLVVTRPPSMEGDAGVLDRLPDVAGLAFPAAGALLEWVAHRTSRNPET